MNLFAASASPVALIAVDAQLPRARFQRDLEQANRDLASLVAAGVVDQDHALIGVDTSDLKARGDRSDLARRAHFTIVGIHGEAGIATLQRFLES